MVLQEKIQKLIKIESDITELKEKSNEYSEQITKLKTFFAAESSRIDKATEISNELNAICNKRRMVEIKLDLLEQVKKRYITA